jgi:hypothetical protein
MKKFLSGLACSILLTGSCFVILQAQEPKEPDPARPMQPKKRGGIANMYALDPLSRALCFRDGKEGLSFENNRWANRCSDLTFSLAGDGSFVTGVEANRIAAIVDLGTPDELRQRYGYDDAESGGEGFASLRLVGDKIMILKDDNPREELQPLKEGPRLFSELGPSANAPIKLGHIYILRIADQKDRSYQQIVKLMVIAYRPNELVTLRWESLLDRQS